MKIKARDNYFDLQRKQNVTVGDEYEVSEERGKYLINVKLAEEVASKAENSEPVKEKPVKKTETPERKKSTRKSQNKS